MLVSAARRRARGLGALGAFLLGTCLFPLLHVGTHRANHVHNPDGSIELTPDDDDEQPAEGHNLDHQHGHEHGDGSFAHFAAFLDPLLPELALPGRAGPVLEPARFLAVSIEASPRALRARSRGPPQG